jgi:hypothetical protein
MSTLPPELPIETLRRHSAKTAMCRRGGSPHIAVKSIESGSSDSKAEQKIIAMVVTHQKTPAVTIPHTNVAEREPDADET